MRGKNVIITGANRGIGKAMVETFANAGSNIWACMRKESEEFIAWKTNLEYQNGIWIKPVYFDNTNEEALKAAIQTIFDSKIQIDVLINNAGISTVSLLSQSKIDDIRILFDVNFFSMLSIIQKVSKKMIRQHSGVIINMGSVAGIESQSGKIAYGCSKAAVIHATKCLSKELGPHGIRVNAIAPGPIETEMIHQYNDEMLLQLSKDSSLRRLGKPNEIAQVALFLASEKSSYINGVVIKVDGGR